MLAYNCSPSFNWRKHLDDGTIEKFQRELGEMGYKFQFITLAGFHALNYSMFDLARGYAAEGMPAYVRLQDAEFAAEARGYTATRHQREVGTGYFDLVTSAITPDAVHRGAEPAPPRASSSRRALSRRPRVPTARPGICRRGPAARSSAPDECAIGWVRTHAMAHSPGWARPRAG